MATMDYHYRNRANENINNTKNIDTYKIVEVLTNGISGWKHHLRTDYRASFLKMEPSPKTGRICVEMDLPEYDLLCPKSKGRTTLPSFSDSIMQTSEGTDRTLKMCFATHKEFDKRTRLDAPCGRPKVQTRQTRQTKSRCK
ncbi:hypothetical protein PVK06_035421 [Gossypium arboreum]|uniref:Uncharacterized protein n=1 Tax=Gossypium arboreum TaxID=29729 RepID=A0ABR0NJU4_GOSAR|nr:hypothetical protein PVK06_035421 [Gossypium arboreum]